MQNTLYLLFFIVVCSAWFISELIINKFFRSGTSDGDQDKGTRRIIWITIAIFNNLGIIIAVLLKFDLSTYAIVPFAGLLLILAGMVIRFIAVRSLGRFFTVNVTIREDHKIIQTGLYKLIRHPAYSGSLISFFGLGIALNNWISVFVITIPITIAFMNRIKIEEALLTDQFGEAYTEYMKRTYCLIPLIY